MAEILLANNSSYQRAISLLKSGKSVVLPTETVYGIAALATNEAAIKNLFAAKNRPLSKPLSICVFSSAQADEICHVSPLAKRLMDAFWPGPLTLVLPKKSGANINPFAHANMPNIGIRCPDIAWRNTFKNMGFSTPLALTSANISGRLDPQTAQEVNTEIGKKIALIIDGGPCAARQSSSVIAVIDNTAKILRKGILTPETFAHLSIEWQI